MRYKRFKRIAQKAEFIDEFIDHYRRIRRRISFPHKAAETVIKLLFPRSKHLGRGAYKSVYYVYSQERDLVLKLSPTKNLKRDFKVYEKVPETIRNRYIAKMYWHTRYCLLQKLGKRPRKLSEKDPRLIDLKYRLKPYGLTDIRPDNVCLFKGNLKVVDANLSRRK
ncbi:MAG: hypothetical protein NTX01_00560 [Candidatus Omnitrophica bacterium]|nr:hypothetical protein [Candidatus Omnitrophota bacterium]